MNQVTLMGRLTRDPEIKYSNSETPIVVARYSLAVRRKKTKDDDQDADFIDIVAFNKQGEFARDHLKKGQLITVIGRIHQDRWLDSENIKHSRIEVIVRAQQAVGIKKEAEALEQDALKSDEIAAELQEKN